MGVHSAHVQYSNNVFQKGKSTIRFEGEYEVTIVGIYWGHCVMHT